jgi:NitT/TauT family transport system substrate-binding protein
MIGRALLILLALGAGCEKKTAAPSGGPERAKLVLNWVPEPEFGGWYAAREAGLFKKHGLEVEIQGGGAGVPVLQMVAGGQADFGIAGADEILIARARGVDVVPLFAVFQKSPQAIMVHAQSGAKSIGDVFGSGMTLALEPGLPYALWLKKKHGFDKVKVVPYDGGVARFVKDKSFAQQCYITSEPIAAKRAGAEPKVFLVAEDGFDPYLGVVIARKKLLSERPALVHAFLEATREGWRAYLDDPKGANAVMGKLNAAMDAETFSAAAEAQRPLIEIKAPLGSMERARWETLAGQLVELKVIDAAPPSDAYWVTAP